jgi:hypothetical protein
MLSDGDGGPCQPAEVSSPVETATDKERREQDYACTPCNEEKTEVRPVATHCRKCTTSGSWGPSGVERHAEHSSMEFDRHRRTVICSHYSHRRG